MAAKTKHDVLGLAKKALQTSIPTKLPCRESEIHVVQSFVKQHLTEKMSGSLYISGAPGTGKTAVVQHVLDKLEQSYEKSAPYFRIFINCMNLGSPGLIFEQISISLNLGKANNADWKEGLTTRMTTKTGKMILLVLDEIDQLLTTRGNEFLYKIFEMTRLPNSKLILVGVANSLDLTSRHLPMLNTPSSLSSPLNTPKTKKNLTFDKETECQLLHFPPYERDQIAQILQSRLASVGSEVFDQVAIKLVAAKVASSTGDIRKALNACKTALDEMEKKERLVLKETSDDGFNTLSPKKRCLQNVEEKVGIGSISKVLGPQKDDGTLPHQQLLLIATLLRINRQAPNSKHLPYNGVESAIPITSIYEEYRAICGKQGYEFIDMSDMISIFGMLEDRSLVSISQIPGTPSNVSKKGLKRSKVKTQGLFFDPKTLEFILRQGDGLISIVNS